MMQNLQVHLAHVCHFIAELKETIEGTAVKLLDDFENLVALKAVQHRDLRLKAAIAAKEQHQNFWPLMLKSDSDYPENGELLDPRQLQSDYWVRAYYSLFMSITAFLSLQVWLCTISALPAGTALTLTHTHCTRPHPHTLNSPSPSHSLHSPSPSQVLR